MNHRDSETRRTHRDLGAGLCFALLLLVSSLTGCGDSGSTTQLPATTASAPATSQAESQRPRVISTSPAATLMLVQIGADDALVGVTKYDQLFLPANKASLPVVGDYESLNYEALQQLKPTVLVLQMAEHRIESRLRNFAADHHVAMVNIKLDTTADMFATAQRLGHASGHESDALTKINLAKAELAQIAADVSKLNHPKVVYVVTRSPMSIAGSQNFLDEVITLAGGENVGAKAGKLWPSVGTEVLLQLAPEVILVGAPGEAAQVPGDPRTVAFLKLNIPAAHTGRVFVVTDPNSQMVSLDIARQVRLVSKLIYAGTLATPER